MRHRISPEAALQQAREQVSAEMRQRELAEMRQREATHRRPNKEKQPSDAATDQE